MTDVPGTVYLLHFNQRIGNPDKPKGQAQHYTGWSTDVPARIASHTAAGRPQPGTGKVPAIVAYVQAQGIGFQLARTWEGTRRLERRLKKSGAARRCPICKAERSAR